MTDQQELAAREAAMGEETHSPTARDTPAGSAHSPLPWAVHPRFRCVIVPLGDIDKSVGGASDPDIEAAEYAKDLANTEMPSCDRFPEFHRSRVWKAEAIANAAFIVRAVNAHAELLAALKGFLAQWAIVEPLINSAFVMQHVHGVTYTGPSLGRELDAMRAAVQNAEGR